MSISSANQDGKGRYIIENSARRFKSHDLQEQPTQTRGAIDHINICNKGVLHCSSKPKAKDLGSVCSSALLAKKYLA